MARDHHGVVADGEARLRRRRRLDAGAFLETRAPLRCRPRSRATPYELRQAKLEAGSYNALHAMDYIEDAALQLVKDKKAEAVVDEIRRIEKIDVVHFVATFAILLSGAHRHRSRRTFPLAPARFPPETREARRRPRHPPASLRASSGRLPRPGATGHLRTRRQPLSGAATARRLRLRRPRAPRDAGGDRGRSPRSLPRRSLPHHGRIQGAATGRPREHDDRRGSDAAAPTPALPVTPGCRRAAVAGRPRQLPSISGPSATAR